MRARSEALLRERWVCPHLQLARQGVELLVCGYSLVP